MTEQEHNEHVALTLRFAQMRKVESETTPPIPQTSATPLAMSSGWTNFGGFSALPRVAAGLALVAFVVGLVFDQSKPEDPAALYTEIMAGQSIATDALLDVSEGVLPAMHNLPGLYENEFDLNTDSLFN